MSTGWRVTAVADAPFINTHVVPDITTASGLSSNLATD